MRCNDQCRHNTLQRNPVEQECRLPPRRSHCLLHFLVKGTYSSVRATAHFAEDRTKEIEARRKEKEKETGEFRAGHTR